MKTRKQTQNLIDCNFEAEVAYENACDMINKLQEVATALMRRAERNHDNGRADWNVTGSLKAIAHGLSSIDF